MNEISLILIHSFPKKGTYKKSSKNRCEFLIQSNHLTLTLIHKKINCKKFVNKDLN